MITYRTLTRFARPMVAELRDMGPQPRERLQDLLMFDDEEYDKALVELERHNLVEQTDDCVVRVTDAGVRLVDEERGD